MLKSISTSIARHLLTVLAGYLGAEGSVTDNNVQIVSAAILVILTLAWSYVEKKIINIKPVDYSKMNK